METYASTEGEPLHTPHFFYPTVIIPFIFSLLVRVPLGIIS